MYPPSRKLDRDAADDRQSRWTGLPVVAADYFGKGRSPEPNSYIVKPSTQQACFDMLMAAQAVSVDLGIEFTPLFSGWSQGGWRRWSFSTG